MCMGSPIYKVIDMKKFYILLVALFIVASSCQRSQFSTTSRQTQNGKVTYINNYHEERSKKVKSKSHKNHIKEADSQHSLSTDARTEKQAIIKSEITEINVLKQNSYENLIASTSNEPTIVMLNKNRNFIDADSYPDTINRNKSSKGAIMDIKLKQLIKGKNGDEKNVYIISRSHDTLFYKLIKEPDIIRGVKLEQIDTIIQISNFDSAKANVIDTRKTEKFGLVGFIFSFLGLFPFLGLPFSILAIIFGAVSLRKIKHYPEQYKGIENARASLVIGIIGLAITAGILIAFAISGTGSVSLF
jgi:hypothetical protein